MPITVAGSAAAVGTAGTTGFTVTIPAATAAGDRIVVVVMSRDHTSAGAFPTVTDNRGNTYTRRGSSTNRKLSIFEDVAVAAGSGGGTVTVAGCIGSATGGLAVLNGAHPTDALTNLVFESNASGNESHAGFTPTAADSWVGFAVGNPTNDTIVVTNLAAATLGTLEPELWERGSTGGSDTYAIFTGKLSPGGPTNTGTFTWSQTNSVTESVSFAVPPVVGPEEHTGGSEASLSVDTEGAGSKSGTSGSETNITVDTEGSGSKVGTGGSEASATVGTEGGGSSVRTGGSICRVHLTGTGAGVHHGAGGSASVIPIDTEGAGVKTSSGGSVSSAEVDTQGDGSKQVAGGSEVPITVHTTGGGGPPDQHGGGSICRIHISTSGGGHKLVARGAFAPVLVHAMGGGIVPPPPTPERLASLSWKAREAILNSAHPRKSP